MGGPDTASDLELLDAWRAGDRAAGSALFKRHYAAVMRFFRAKVDAGHLDDLIQRTFLACVEGAGRFRGEGSFRGYLLGIAYHRLCKHYRSAARERARIDFASVSACDLAPSPSEVHTQRREQRLLLEALRRLPLDVQTALELHYWEGMTGAEIAAVLELPLGTAKARIRRGRELVERELGRLNESPALLESTLSDLEGWARGLRDRLADVD